MLLVTGGISKTKCACRLCSFLLVGVAMKCLYVYVDVQFSIGGCGYEM